MGVIELVVWTYKRMLFREPEVVGESYVKGVGYLVCEA